MKIKALISCAVTGQLICAFVFIYAKSRFSHDTAEINNGLFHDNARTKSTVFQHKHMSLCFCCLYKDSLLVSKSKLSSFYIAYFCSSAVYSMPDLVRYRNISKFKIDTPINPDFEQSDGCDFQTGFVKFAGKTPFWFSLFLIPISQPSS